MSTPCLFGRSDDPGEPCQETATVALVGPGGGGHGYYCRQHGSAIVAEYREKLGEVWTLRDIVPTYLPPESRLLRRSTAPR